MTGKAVDITGFIQKAFHLFRGKLSNSSNGLFDGFILRLHYKFVCFFTLGAFFTVWYGWYFGKVIHCVNAFKGDQEARGDYQNICLSYPFTKSEDGNKKFLLFYRWTHWAFLFFSIVFYIPRKISKSIEDSKAKKLIDDIATLSSKYDSSEKEVVQRAFYYMITNLRTHDCLYYKYLSLIILVFGIDIFVLLFTDFMLQNRFISLVPNAFPFHRDPVLFKDYISETFPPFASCILNDVHKILDGREEVIGCHLIHMELYEKLFIIFWFIIYFITVLTFLHIVYLALMLAPSLREKYITIPRPFLSIYTVHALTSNIVKNSLVGDIFLLNHLKQHLKPKRFYEMLICLNDPKYTMANNVRCDESKSKTFSSFKNSSTLTTRNRENAYKDSTNQQNEFGKTPRDMEESGNRIYNTNTLANESWYQMSTMMLSGPNPGEINDKKYNEAKIERSILIE